MQLQHVFHIRHIVCNLLQGIDPWAYLFDVLNRLADHPASRIEELTPRGWRLAREV